jgi:hypothetical protein
MSAANAQFIDAIKERIGVQSDAELSRQLGCNRSRISTVRSGGPVSAPLQIAILEATNWGLWEMRAKMKGAG